MIMTETLQDQMALMDNYRVTSIDGISTETPEPSVPESILIRPSRLADAQNKIDKANARLIRAGISEQFTLIVGPTETKTYTSNSGLPETYDMVPVTLDVPKLGYNGWTFVATLAFETAGTIVRTVPGQSCDYRPSSQECDQCHTSRFRNDTFVVRNDETGEYKQVGRNCLALFFGLTPALWVFTYDLDEFNERNADENERSSWGRDRTEDVRRIIAAALAVSDSGRGYKRADVHPSTKDETSDILYARDPGMLNHRLAGRSIWLTDNRALAAQYESDGTVDAVLTVCQSIAGDSEYAQNVRILANCERVDMGNFGIVASFVTVYARQLRYEAEQVAKQASRDASVNEWLGTVGQKNLTTTGTVTSIRTIDGQYGTTYLITWLTDTGHTCKWFASNPPEAVSEGATVTLRGTVKSHETYRDYRSTVFTRCKIV
jgi:hypothetical protein